MQIFILDESLVELIDSRLLVEMLEDGEVLLVVDFPIEVSSDFSGLAEPRQEVHDVFVGVHFCAFAIQQAFFLQFVQPSPLLLDHVGDVLAVGVVVEAEAEQQIFDVGRGVEMAFQYFERPEEES